MMALAQPGYLALLAVVLAMAAAAVWLARWRRRARERFAGPQAQRWPASPFWPRTVLMLGAATLIVIAAARPQWGEREVRRERQGVDLVIVLDISQSMQATDVEPSRLGRAQEQIVRLVEAERGNRIGLVFFAGTAIVRSPLTTDALALAQLVERADREAGLTRAGSDIGAALRQAGRILEASESDGKAVIVVSDGEDHAGAYADQARALHENGIAVFAAGVGTPDGAALSDRTITGQARPKLDAAGRPVISRLHEETLRAVASEGGGRYIRLGDDDLSSFRDDLAHLEQTPLGQELQKLPVERFQLFVGAALALLVLGWLLPVRLALPAGRPFRRLRPYPGLALLALVLLIGACGSDPLHEDNARANRLFAEGDYEGALAAYEELIAQRPDVPELAYNAGNALHRLERYARAVTETRRALPPSESRLGAATYYSLGNHYLALDRFEEAYEAYKSALLLDPGDADAKHNLEVALLLMLGAQQPPDGAGQPPDAGQPPPGEGTPAPSDSGQPGASPTQTPPADATPGAPGSAPRTLEEALRGIDRDFTFEEAIEILELLRQQQAQPLPGPPSLSTEPDY